MISKEKEQEHPVETLLRKLFSQTSIQETLRFIARQKLPVGDQWLHEQLLEYFSDQKQVLKVDKGREGVVGSLSSLDLTMRLKRKRCRVMLEPKYVDQLDMLQVQKDLQRLQLEGPMVDSSTPLRVSLLLLHTHTTGVHGEVIRSRAAEAGMVGIGVFSRRILTTKLTFTLFSKDLG